MTLAALMNRPCTITRRSPSATATDESGDAVDDIATTETVCEIQQKTREEPPAGGEVSADEWILFLPIGTGLDTSDQVDVHQVGVFEVVGNPWQADTGTAAVHHVEATVKRVADSETGS